jgi:hypothetical protein
MIFQNQRTVLSVKRGWGFSKLVSQMNYQKKYELEQVLRG